MFMKYPNYLFLFISVFSIHAYSDSFSETQTIIDLMNSISECPNGKYYTITTSALNIRDKPNGTIVGRYHHNDTFCVFETKKGWSNTYSTKSSNNGPSGWVSHQYIKPALKPAQKRCDYPSSSLLYHACQKYNASISNTINTRKTTKEESLSVNDLSKYIAISEVKYHYDSYHDRDGITSPNYTSLHISLNINNKLKSRTIEAEVKVTGQTEKGRTCSFGCVFWGGKEINEIKRVKIKPGRNDIRIYVDLLGKYTHIGLTSFLYLYGNPGRVGTKLVGDKPNIEFQIKR